MSVMDMNSRMAMAEKLSVQQLQQAVQSGSLPAYIGIPLIEQKTKEKAQMAAAQGEQQKPQSVAASILQQAEQQEQQDQGIDRLPSNLPMMDDEEMGMANGGIIAFAERGQVVDPYSTYGDIDPLAQFSGLTQADVDRDIQKQLKERREKQREADIRQREFLMRNAPGSVASFDFGAGEFEAINSPTTPSSGMGDMDATAGTTYTPPPTGAGQRNQGTPNAPAGGTPPRTAQPGQAPAVQSEGQSALDKYAAMLMAEREGSGKERDKAKAMAIFQAGLGIAGGTSPNALANIAQGALPATQAYQQELRGIRKEDAARIKELMGLGISKEKLALEAKKLGISEKRFNQMYELETQKLGIMGGSRADAAKNSEALRRDQLAKGYFELLLKQNPMATESEQDVLRDRARAFAARDAGGTAPSASSSSVMGTYTPGKGYIPK